MAEITLEPRDRRTPAGRSGGLGASASAGPLPFREAIDFFRQKNPLPSASWTEFWQGQHDRAFVVAGAMRQELVDDFFTTIDRLRTQGKGYAAFLDEFDRIVARHGWQYNGSRGWRSRVIWRTNMRTSYQAGRYRQMKEVAERRPFWQYHHSDLVADPRPHHVALDGTILPHDHPFWSTHFPPNGWGCQCYVTTHSRRDLERQGLTVSADPEITWRDVTVGTRGPYPRQVRVPEGIDPGWAYAPGRSWVEQAVERTAATMDSVSADVAAVGAMAAAQQRLLERWFLERWFLEGAENDFPLVVLSDETARSLGAKTRVGLLSADTRRKQLERHPELTASEYVQAQRVILEGQSIRENDTSLVYALEVPGPVAGGYVLSVKATRQGDKIYVTSFRRMSRDRARREQDLNRLFSKEGR